MKKCFFALTTILFLLTSCNNDVAITLPSAQVSSQITETLSENSSLDEGSAIYQALMLTSTANYKVLVQGSVNAKKAFFSFDQAIENEIIVNGDNWYSKSVSNSIVRSEHEAYYDKNKVLYRSDLSKNIFTELSYLDYKEKFGVTPKEDLLGLIVNDTTVIKSNPLTTEENLSVFSYELDPTSAAVNVAKQVKELGSLNSYPSFSKIDIKLFFNKNNLLVKMLANNCYQIDITFFGKMNCYQKLTYNFTYQSFPIIFPEK